MPKKVYIMNKRKANESKIANIKKFVLFVVGIACHWFIKIKFSSNSKVF